MAQAVDAATTSGPRTVPTIRTVVAARSDYRIVCCGKDVTWIDGIKTPPLTYSLVSPLRYGSGSITFPQFHAALESFGSATARASCIVPTSIA